MSTEPTVYFFLLATSSSSFVWWEGGVRGRHPGLRASLGPQALPCRPHQSRGERIACDRWSAPHLIHTCDSLMLHLCIMWARRQWEHLILLDKVLTWMADQSLRGSFSHLLFLYSFLPLT